MKKCIICNEEKAITEFYKDSAVKDGYRKECKTCKDKRTNEWRTLNRSKYNSTMRSYNKKHYERLRIQRYKLIPEQYAKMVADQNNCCAICNKPPTTKRPLNIDHDHLTNKARGLLCHGCNRLMVLLDDVKLYHRAMVYKAKYS